MSFYEIKGYTIKDLILKFNQSSNVFTYYILKSILSLNFSNILFALDHFNINSIKSGCNVDSCDMLVKYIKKIFNESHNKYKTLLDKLINLKFDDIDLSLRMTIFGHY